MASFGKLTNTFLQASQETTVALANLNFDFALIKYDAPEEYRGLGEALSTRRKDVAENGAVHITARKLGALFGSAVPQVPSLIHAYGLRASEVAKQPTVNPKGTARQGVFADHVGADGTSIWAAATSGTDAVTVHLLACLLARIWRREEAVPIWCELVEHRKAHLQAVISEQGGSTLSVSDLTASRIEISRSQLDEWDTSARAWLQTADEAKKREQTQFRLLVDNLSLPVSTNASVYAAIMESWIKAMKGLDSLIQGAPQRIDNGAVLLGLLAWHLYPDILLADTNQYVKQSDPLISSGGVITIGLKNRDDDGRGVVWSLPLSQARYYGDPVIATRHAGVGESRISFSDFTFVVLGSLLGGWKIPGVSLEVGLNLIRTVSKPFSNPPPSSRLGDMAWASMLVDAVTEFNQSRDGRRQHITRLISFGQRRHAWFRCHGPAPMFGLTDLCTLLVAFGDDTKGRIDFLRNWAVMALGPELQAHAIIRFRQGGRLGRVRYTRVQHPANLHKRQKVGVSDHQRPSAELYPQWVDDELVLELDAADSSEDDPQLDLPIPVAPGAIPEPHVFVCGDPNLAAIYVSDRCSSSLVARARAENRRLTLSQLTLCMEEGYIVENHIVTALTSIARETKHFEGLQAFSVAGHIYSKLNGARVDLQVTSRRISAAKWWKAYAGSHKLPLAASLSCIAYFETGGLDIDPESIEGHTFAMCYSTSIFVASSMLSDPINAAMKTGRLGDENSSVERIIGNVGKPGLVFLIAPPNPRKRELDYGSWHMIAHEPFDGTAQDNFQQTSFHLSFTGYSLPLDVGVRGGCDTSAYFLETAISIYDRGEWVADVDILSAMQQWHFLSEKVSCGHPDEPQFEARESPSLVSIDTWLELLDPPIQDTVVRAHGNPIARLAAAALAVRQFQTVIVLSDPVCWKCCADEMRRQRNISPGRGTHSKSGEHKIHGMAEDVHSGVNMAVNGSGLDDAEVYAFDLSPVGSGIQDLWDEDGQGNGPTRVGGIALIY